MRVTNHPEPFNPLSVLPAPQLALLCREDSLSHRLARVVQTDVKVLPLKVNNSLVPGLTPHLAKHEKANHIPSLYSSSRAFFTSLPAALQGSFRQQEPSAHCLIPQAQFSWHCLFINSPDRDAFSLEQAARSQEAS